jgi:hypothetical protein
MLAAFVFQGRTEQSFHLRTARCLGGVVDACLRRGSHRYRATTSLDAAGQNTLLLAFTTAPIRDQGVVARQGVAALQSEQREDRHSSRGRRGHRFVDSAAGAGS